MENNQQALQSKIIELAKKLESAQADVSALREQLETALSEAGIDAMMQDPSTGAVYKVVRPHGRFVSFPTIGYVRTRIKLAGEKSGGLSLTEAKNAGFEVE